MYFGPWSDPVGALAKYQQECEFWEAGINPRLKIDPQVAKIDLDVGVRLGDGCNLFLDRMLHRVERSELSKRSYSDYKSTLARMLTVISRHVPIQQIEKADWIRLRKAISDKRGPVSIIQDITRIKTCFKWLVRNEYIKAEPNYDEALKKPARVEVRRSRANRGKRWFDASEIQLLLKNATPPLRAMVLLGVNCGFGNGDCSQLKAEYIDFKGGWVDFDRPKTGTSRRAKLWPETISVIREYQKARPKLKAKWLFVTKYGNQWSNPDSSECAVSREFQKLCKDTGIHTPGRGFYGLRRTFETVAGGTKDQVAVDYVMGHIDDSMAGVYRQTIEDSRLEAISQHVHAWLFASPVKKSTRKKA